MAQQLVSVIMPMFNSSLYVQDAIDSLRKQTYNAFEVLVVDDGSTDNSVEVVRAAVRGDERFRIIVQENKGAATARNTGLSHAKGLYVMFLDSDDTFAPDMIAAMVEAATASSADLVVCEAQAIGPELAVRSTDLSIADTLPSGLIKREEYWPQQFTAFSERPWDKLIKKSIVVQNNIEFQNLPNCNDVYFSQLLYLYVNSIYLLRSPLVYYRVGSGNTAQDSRSRYPCCDLYAADAVWEVVRMRGLHNRCRERDLLNWCIEKFFMSFALACNSSENAGGEVYDKYVELYERKWLAGFHYSGVLVRKLTLLKYWAFTRVSRDKLIKLYAGRRYGRYDSSGLVTKSKFYMRLLIEGMIANLGTVRPGRS